MATEDRAQYIVERHIERPSLRYERLCWEVREKFGCGKTASEQAVKRAYEILRQQWDDPERKRRIAAMLEEKYMSWLEDAERRGERRTARLIADSLARLRGVTTDRHELVVTTAKPDLAPLSDEQLALASMFDQSTDEDADE
jgi:hypothetical protein